MDLDGSRPAHAAACGSLVTALRLLAGVSGPLLDLFFLKSSLSRLAIVGTKAATQCLGHAVKIAYFAGIAEVTGSLHADTYVVVVVAALAGTYASRAWRSSRRRLE